MDFGARDIEPDPDLSGIMFGNLIETAAEATGLAHAAIGTDSFSSDTSSSKSPPFSSLSSSFSFSSSSDSSSLEADESSDYSDIPTFALDSGATGSYGSRQTPLDTSKSTNRKIGGIGGIIIQADREGRCKAIPNVALSDGIRRNLASVSQLT